MAVTVTPVFAGATRFIADVEATADGDLTSGNIAHGLGAVPLSVFVTPLQQAAGALSAWAATTLDATNVVLTKSGAAGSGVAGAQVRVEVALPHSLTR